MVLKPAKGEMSVGLIIGLVLIVVIIIGLIVWSRSNKSADMTPEDNVSMTGETQSATTTTTSTTTNGTPTTTTTTATVPVESNPTLPQTGMGPDAK